MINDTLHAAYGDSGPYVEMLQLALTRADTNPGFIDGRFGPATYRALITFQKRNGLTPDGILGPKTAQALTPYLTGYVPVTVRAGDTFYRLARKYGTTTEAIIAANPSVNPLNLSVGTELTIPLNFSIVPTSISYTYLLTCYCLEGLAARYPFIRLSVIGTSILGRNLYVAGIGAGSHQVLYNASHHANEWITTPVLLKFLEDYAQAYSTGGNIYDTEAEQLFAESRISIVPLVNPDGVDLVTGAIQSGPSYQEALAISRNYPEISFPSGWKANIVGTDLNLNYPAQWERAREIKFEQGFTSPAPRDYVGTGPLSAPESSALYQYTLENNFSLTLSYHTQGQVIYWKFADYNPPGALEIGRLFSQLSGYALETTPYASGFAGYKDWFIQNYNRPGYTMECGLGENPLPVTQFPKIYRDNLGVLVTGARPQISILPAAQQETAP